MTALTVVIASHDAGDTLGDQLSALTSQPWPDGGEIVVADNRSVDDTVAVVERFSHAPIPVRRIAVDDRAGAGHARNRGVAVSNSAAIAFCDADDVVGAGWVASMATGLEDHAVVVGPLDFTRLNPPWLAGLRGRRMEAGEIARFDDTFPIASSCNLGIRKELFDSLGGFDDYFRCAEDADLSLRLWRRGVPLFHDDDALVHYRLRSGVRAVFEQSRTWGRARAPLRSALNRPHRQDVSGSIRSWVWLVATLPMVMTRAGRMRWLHVAGLRVGTLEGEWRARRRPVPVATPVGPDRSGRW